MFFNRDKMDKNALLKEMDCLCYDDRSRRIALLARENMNSKGFQKLLSSLIEGSTYEASLALIGAGVIKDIKIILLALKHPKESIRIKAAGLLGKLGSASDIERELFNLSKNCRRKLLNTITIKQREDVAERLIDLVYDNWGAKETVILLPACGEETVRKWISQIGYAIENWFKLAQRHRDIVGDYFYLTLEKAPLREKTHVWWKFSTAIEILSISNPQLVLEAALNFGPKDFLHPVLKKHLGILVRRCPEKVYGLITRIEGREYLLANGVPKILLKNKKYFSTDQWIEISKLLAERPDYVVDILQHLAPSRRGEVFQAVYDEDKRKEQIFSVALLSNLPNELRDKESARILELPTVKSNHVMTMNIVACRYIDNSREILKKEAQSSNADERGNALSLLIQSTALSRKGMGDTLEYLARIKNDQDPVRYRVLSELEICPPSIFNDTHVPALTLIIDSLIEARDSSVPTLWAAKRLVFNLMIHNAKNLESEIFKFSINTLIKLARKSGSLSLPSLEHNCPRGLEYIIFEEIYTLIVEANRRENYSFILEIANSFGKRAYGIEKLQNLLKEAIFAKPDSVSMRAVTYWLADKATRDKRVMELLEMDKSFIKVPEVMMHVHRRRQDLLDQFISGNIIRGRFFTGKTIYLLPLYSGFHRWLPRQQKTFLALLERVASDRERNIYERTQAIKTMAMMPEVSVEEIKVYLKDREIYIIEAALHALSLTEEPDKALSILLENLEGDKARVAAYSIGRCFRRIGPKELNLKLHELLNKDKLKITVRKEAIRLLGDYKNKDSIGLLQQEFEKENQHKDIQIAIGHAARQCMDDVRAWEILKKIAASPDRDLPRSLLNQSPQQLPEEYKAQYFELIATVAKHQESDVSTEAYNTMRYWTRGFEEIVASTTLKAILNLEDTMGWIAAMNTLVEASRDGKVNEIVIDAFRKLIRAKIEEHWNANTQRDLPNRRRLAVLADKLTSLPRLNRLNLIDLYKGIIRCLSEDKTINYTSTKFYLACIDWNDTKGSVEYINCITKCLEDQKYFLSYVCRDIRDNLKETEGYWKPETLLKIVDEVSIKVATKEMPGESEIIALTLLEVAGKVLLWSKDCAERLRSFRNHEDLEIRALAMEINTGAPQGRAV